LTSVFAEVFSDFNFCRCKRSILIGLEGELMQRGSGSNVCGVPEKVRVIAQIWLRALGFSA
jgi:hypothetical protein